MVKMVSGVKAAPTASTLLVRTAQPAHQDFLVYQARTVITEFRVTQETVVPMANLDNLVSVDLRVPLVNAEMLEKPVHLDLMAVPVKMGPTVQEVHLVKLVNTVKMALTE